MLSYSAALYPLQVSIQRLKSHSSFFGRGTWVPKGCIARVVTVAVACQHEWPVYQVDEQVASSRVSSKTMCSFRGLLDMSQRTRGPKNPWIRDSKRSLRHHRCSTAGGWLHADIIRPLCLRARERRHLQNPLHSIQCQSTATALEHCTSLGTRLTRHRRNTSRYAFSSRKGQKREDHHSSGGDS